MTHQLFVLGKQALTEQLTLPAAWYVKFFLTGTTTPTPTYTTSALDPGAMHPEEVTAGSDGRLPAVYLDPQITYKCSVYNSADVFQYTIDPCNDVILSAAVIGALLYPQTEGEANAGITPTNKRWPPGWVFRYQTNTTPGTTDMADAFQDAIDSADSTYPQVFFTGDCAISKPLLLRSTTTQSLSIIGTGRVSSNLMPLTSDISVVTQGINCMLFNQSNNLNLRLANFRWLSATNPGYTGVFMYAKEGGGNDSSGQAMFSMVVDNVWLAPQSTNGGGFQGGFSNLICQNSVGESLKEAFWMLEGAGNSDHHHSNITLNASFDRYIYASADTTEKGIIRISGLHAYQHLRGVLIDCKNLKGLHASDVQLEPDAANFGTTGLYKVTDCADMNVGRSTATVTNTAPRGACGIELIGACSRRMDGQIVAADVGLRISGAGAMDVSIFNSDFTGCQYAVQHLSGNTSGKLSFHKCRFNFAEYCWLTSAGTPTYDIDFIDCDLVDAGYSDVSTGRVMNLNTSGNVVFRRCRIGRTDAAHADAVYWLLLRGAGTVTFDECDWIGTPPTGILDPASTQAPVIIYKRGLGTAIASAATITLPMTGDVFSISGTTNITSIAADLNAGRRITLIFQDALTFTDGSNLKLAGNLVTTADDSISLVCDGTNWYETGRSVN